MLCTSLFSITVFAVSFCLLLRAMAASMEVTLKNITVKQKKLGERIALCEETVYEMLLAFIDLLGTKCPVKLRKVAKRWEDVRDEGQVVIKPKVVSLDYNYFANSVIRV